MRRFSIAVLIVCITTTLWARLRSSPGFEDIPGLTEQAPLVFRGHVKDVALSKNRAGYEPGYKEGVAVIDVDRWYRGSQAGNSVRLHLVYSHLDNGHDCVDFTMGSYWIVFARPAAGGLVELAHDCSGALTISPLLAPKTSTDFLSQMELDFAAGLNDSDSDARIASIQRLAALRQKSAAGPLHHVIASGSELESKWAIFAALRIGDSSVLPLAVPVLLTLKHEEAKRVQLPNGFVYTETHPYPQPEGNMAVAVSEVRAPEAVPSLRKLAAEAPDTLVRDCARQALRAIGEQSAEHKK